MFCSFLKVFAIYSHGGHLGHVTLGHVTLTFYTKFHPPYLTMLHIKFGFNWPSFKNQNLAKFQNQRPSGSGEEDF